ncbi:hypothetical protein [Secundilactobacillus odoratitofui]|uniref:hypothetical protein n=1 Tax=Secundilactobacillus odoratitofui TaxID=480930 RepID=UPI0006D05A3B|nr:hypothetical protein [Secundilactobacillus odoratitofui]
MAVGALALTAHWTVMRLVFRLITEAEDAQRLQPVPQPPVEKYLVAEGDIEHNPYPSKKVVPNELGTTFRRIS